MKKEYDYVIYKFKFGFLKIESYEDAVISIKCVSEDEIDNNEKPTALLKKVVKELDEYFSGKRKTFDIPISFNGTEFQKKVWNALLEIPYGETRSYKDIAEHIGNPKACRAVGMANHNNPISIIVPCHRVIGKNGSLTGYAGGLDMKNYLLQLEKSNI